jgi:NADPH:quinone reductase-like Zn-dependent oxidoreductase
MLSLTGWPALALAALAALAAAAWWTRRPRLALAGKHALITGGSSGIGLALARRLVAAGARVTLVARDARKLRGARDELAGAAPGARVQALSADVTDRAAVAAALAKAEKEFGTLDLLICNAGAATFGAPPAHARCPLAVSLCRRRRRNLPPLVRPDGREIARAAALHDCLLVHIAVRLAARRLEPTPPQKFPAPSLIPVSLNPYPLTVKP